MNGHGAADSAVARSGILRIEISERIGAPDGVLAVGQPARIAVQTAASASRIDCYFRICDHLGHTVANFDSRHVGPADTCEAGACLLACEFERFLVMPGRYRLDAMIIADGREFEFAEGAAAFEVLSGNIDGRPVKHHRRRGNVHIPHRWRLQAAPERRQGV